MALPFKSYLKKEAAYSGGKSRSEIQLGDKEIHKLSSNENALGASPKAIIAIQKQLTNISEYPDRTDERLRNALSDFYQDELSANQFITANGGVGLLELIIDGFMEEGSECIYSNPGFSAYKGFPSKVGATSIDVPLIEHENDFELDVKGILNAINEKTRLVLVTAPNNPTGTCPSKSQIDELVEGLPEDIIMVYDEVYFQYVDRTDYVRAYHYVNSGKNVIGLNSFSKAYGLAGLRIGYAYSSPEIASYLQGIRRPFLIDSISMTAAIAALKDEEFIEQTVNLIHEEKQFLYKELNRLGIKHWKTEANFILIQPDIDAHLFEDLMLKQGIMVRPAKNFGSPGVRVTIGTRHQNKAYIRAMENILVSRN